MLWLVPITLKIYPEKSEDIFFKLSLDYLHFDKGKKSYGTNSRNKEFIQRFSSFSNSRQWGGKRDYSQHTGEPLTWVHDTEIWKISATKQPHLQTWPFSPRRHSPDWWEDKRRYLHHWREKPNHLAQMSHCHTHHQTLPQRNSAPRSGYHLERRQVSWILDQGRLQGNCEGDQKMRHLQEAPWQTNGTAHGRPSRTKDRSVTPLHTRWDGLLRADDC